MLQAAPISTQALADVINQSVDCVKLVNTAGDVLWMNANGLCAMEIDDHTAIYGRRWSDLWPEENRQTVNDALAQAHSGEPVRFEAFCPTAKGSPRWWNVTVTAVTAPDGADIGYLAISRDVTEGETQRRALGIAADELRHRLKNTYAMVCGMLNTFALGNPEHEAFARAMNVRLMALGTAQSFFMGPDMPRDVKALLPALIQPFADARGRRCGGADHRRAGDEFGQARRAPPRRRDRSDGARGRRWQSAPRLARNRDPRSHLPPPRGRSGARSDRDDGRSPSRLDHDPLGKPRSGGRGAAADHAVTPASARAWAVL